MEHEDFWHLLEGWNEKLTYEEGMLRKQTGLIVEALTGKGKGIQWVRDCWPMKLDEAQPNRLVERLKKFTEKEALKKAATKMNGGRTEYKDRSGHKRG